MKIIVSDKAKEDLLKIKFYLKRFFPDHEKNTISTLKQVFLNISENLYLGIQTDFEDIRAYIIPRLPYSVFYKFDNKNLYILRIYHESRNPSKAIH